MADAAILGSRTRRAGLTNVAVDLTGIPDGAWMIVVAMLSASATTVAVPSGWAILWSGETTGTRRNHSFYRVRQSGDANSVTFVQSATTPGGYMLIWGTGNWASRVLGATRVRSTVGSAGSRNQNIAPAVAAPAKSLMLAFTTEASTALVSSDEITGVTPNTWPRVAYLAQPAPSSEIETIGVYWNGFETAQSSGDLTIGYTSPQDNNGWAVQIAIPGDNVTTPGELEPAPGTLNWVGNWDARDNELQVVGKVTGAAEVVLTLDDVEYPATIDADGYFRATATNLLSLDDFDWDIFVDDVLRASDTISTLAGPDLTSGSMRAILGSCYDSYGSGVFAKMWARNPDLYLMVGDKGYSWLSTSPNGPISPTTAPEIRAIREEVFAAINTRRNMDYRVPQWHQYSDCDGAGSNSDSTVGGHTTGATNQTWRQMTANLDLPIAGCGARFMVTGRVRWVMTDELSLASSKDATDNSSKTKLGLAQRAWFFDQIDQAVAAKQAIIWLGDGPFTPAKVTSGTSNEWSRYDTERQLIAAKVTSSGVRIFRGNGDRHGLGADNGSNNPFGSFAWVNAAPIHTTAQPLSLATSEVPTYPPAATTITGAQHYATLDAAWTSETITVTATGWSSSNAEPTEVQRFQMVVDLSYDVPPTMPYLVEWDGTNMVPVQMVEWDGTTMTPVALEEKV